MASDSKGYAERQSKCADFVHGLMYQVRTVKYHSLLPANVFKEQSKYVKLPLGCPYALSAWCPGALTSWDATRFTILEKEAGGHRESSKRSGTRTTQREQKPMEAPHFHCQGGISTPPPCIRFCRLAPGKCLPSAVPHARRVGHTSS